MRTSQVACLCASLGMLLSGCGGGGDDSPDGAGGSGSTPSGGNGSIGDDCDIDACQICFSENEADPSVCVSACEGCEAASGGGGSSSAGGTSGGDGHVPANDCITAQTCNYDSDCSEGGHCNSAVAQCFDPEPVASSVLSCDVVPCNYDSDCPEPWACSTSEGRCFLL